MQLVPASHFLPAIAKFNTNLCSLLYLLIGEHPVGPNSVPGSGWYAVLNTLGFIPYSLSMDCCDVRQYRNAMREASLMLKEQSSGELVLAWTLQESQKPAVFWGLVYSSSLAFSTALSHIIWCQELCKRSKNKFSLSLWLSSFSCTLNKFC